MEHPTMALPRWDFIALVFILVVFLVCAYEFFRTYLWKPRSIRRFMEKQGVKGPAASFMVGNLFAIARLRAIEVVNDMQCLNHDIVDRLLPHYVKYSKIYGKLFILWYGVEPRLTVFQPELIREILSSKYTHSYGKTHVQRKGNKDFIGNGLLMANGEAWAHQRRVVAPAFHAEKLKGHVRHMVECCTQMLNCFDEMLLKGSSEIEIGEHLSKLAGDIIARTEFGSSYEKGKTIFQHLSSLQQLSSESGRYLWFPGSRFLPTKHNREVKRRKNEVEKILMEIIQARRDSVAHVGRSLSYGNDLLGLMISESAERDDDDEFALSLSNQQLMDECKTFFFTGHETTTLLMTWTVMLLASDPHWQQEARSEVLSLCQGRPPCATDLPKMRILGMVLNESLRLYTPASLLCREAYEDVRLGELKLPKGMSLWIPVLAVHHSREIWGEDANEFRPERFAKGIHNACNHPMGFIPFSSGPRNCVGQTFALMEAKLVLAMLLSRFTFALSPNYRHAPVYVLTLKPKHGLQIILQPV